MPAGVSGGECMAEVGGDGRGPMEARWPECADVVRVAGEGEGALEGGSETGSKEKFSIRLAWQRELWILFDRLRISFSASGSSCSVWWWLDSGEAAAGAAEGSISSFTSLKRTACAGCSS